MTARALKVPTVKFNSTGAVLKIPAAVDVYVNHTEKESLSLAFTMNVVRDNFIPRQLLLLAHTLINQQLDF